MVVMNVTNVMTMLVIRHIVMRTLTAVDSANHAKNETANDNSKNMLP